MTATSGGLASNNNGPGAQSTFSTAENVGQVRIDLTPFGERQMPAAEIERRWRAAVGTIEGAERVSFTSSPVRFGADVEFELAHQDEAQLIAAADAMKARLGDIQGLSQIEDSFDIGKRQLVFELTPAGRAAGLRPADIAVQVRQAFFGEEVQRIQRGREEVRVYVRYPEATRASLDALNDLRIQLPDGGPSATVYRRKRGREPGVLIHPPSRRQARCYRYGRRGRGRVHAEYCERSDPWHRDAGARTGLPGLALASSRCDPRAE